MKVFSVDNFTLRLVEDVLMDESKVNPETNKFEKTGSGKKDLYKGYTFIGADEFKEKVYFMKLVANGDWSKLEGKTGKLLYDIQKFGKEWSVKPLDFVVKPETA